MGYFLQLEKQRSTGNTTTNELSDELARARDELAAEKERTSKLNRDMDGAETKVCTYEFIGNVNKHPVRNQQEFELFVS